jgi:hypothetical protein
MDAVDMFPDRMIEAVNGFIRISYDIMEYLSLSYCLTRVSQRKAASHLLHLGMLADFP